MCGPRYCPLSRRALCAERERGWPCAHRRAGDELVSNRSTRPQLSPSTHHCKARINEGQAVRGLGALVYSLPLPQARDLPPFPHLHHQAVVMSSPGDHGQGGYILVCLEIAVCSHQCLPPFPVLSSSLAHILRQAL